MKNSLRCPKCGSGRIARIPDNGRYANGNNIYLRSAVVLADRIPLIKYICFCIADRSNLCYYGCTQVSDPISEMSEHSSSSGQYRLRFQQRFL